MDLSSRQLLVTYVLITFVLGYFLEWFLLRTVGSTYSLPYLVLMLIPGAVGIALAWYSGQTFDNFGFNMPADTHWLTAYATPAAVALFALGLAVACGSGQFVYPGGSAITRLAVFTSTIGVGVSLVPALGFELGWRGFMYTHAERADIPLPGLLTGLCAAAWQWPLVAFGELGNPDLPLLSLGLFTVAGCGSSLFLSWFRARANSIFPVVLAHAVHATWLNQIVPQFLTSPQLKNPYLGEAGVGVAVAYGLIGIACVRLSKN